MKKFKILKHRQIFYCLFTIVYLGIIFFISSIPGVNYTSMIRRILHNLFHIPVYGVLAFLIFKALNQTQNCIIRNLFISGILAFSFGFLNELYQAFIPGRIVSLLDIVLNSIGISIALLMVYFYNMKVQKLES